MTQVLISPPVATGRADGALACAPRGDEGFDFSGLRRFTAVPDHRDFGIVALRGMVIVYDETPLSCEGIIEGAFYVRESQRPRSLMSWETWLKRERDDLDRRVGPVSPLQIRREVVQAVRWPRGGHWALRLASGFTDGPYYDHAFGLDLIGKVAGIYLPDTSARES